MTQHQDEYIRDLPQTTTLPLKDLWKNYMKVAGIFTIFGWITAIIGFVTDWYYLLLMDFWGLCLHNAWLLPAIMVIVGFILLVNHPWKRKKGGAREDVLPKQGGDK